MGIQVIFGVMLLVHGLIHLMGFLKAYEFAHIEQLSSPISRLSGTFWLITSTMLMISGAVVLSDIAWWWMPAAAGVVISQILIFNYWQDAKFGTIANIIILLATLLGFGSWSFHSMVEKEVERFSSSISSTSEVITEGDLTDVPPVVREWLRSSGVVGQPRMQSVHLFQSGKMKNNRNGAWLPIEAKQWIKRSPPGFIWMAEADVATYLPLFARDKYVNGKGHMLVKLLGIYPVTDSKGMEIDQGSLLRYLAEMVWYPSVALEEYISWKQIDDNMAKATMHYKGIIASGVFIFNQQGEVTSFRAERYYARKGGATLETWVVSVLPDSYKEFQGRRIPTRAEVTWKLDQGDFTWYQLVISDVTYNNLPQELEY